MDRRTEALEDAKEQLRNSVRKDQHLVEAVKLLEKLKENREPEVERFRRWYSHHFPELVDELEDEKLLKALENQLNRESMDSFEELAGDSTGAPLGEDEEEILESVREYITEGQELEKKLESYIRNFTEKEMPNLSALLGPVLTAKFIALQGSLESLAKQPSSTVQMLGAEKALFRHLSGEGTAPKHGIIFEHRFVKSLPEEDRGKMARFLANKASIGARMDFYGDKEKGDELFEQAKQKFEELNQEESPDQ